MRFDARRSKNGKRNLIVRRDSTGLSKPSACAFKPVTPVPKTVVLSPDFFLTEYFGSFNNRSIDHKAQVRPATAPTR